jgi:hypothetical protein
VSDHEAFVTDKGRAQCTPFFVCAFFAAPGHATRPGSIASFDSFDLALHAF